MFPKINTTTLGKIKSIGFVDEINMQGPVNKPSQIQDELMEFVNYKTEKGVFAKEISHNIVSQLIKIHEYEINSKNRENESLSIQSIETFFKFLEYIPELIEPGVGKTPDGNVYIEWKSNSHYFIGLEFLKDKRIMYTLFIKYNFENAKYVGTKLVENFLEIFKSKEIIGLLEINYDEKKPTSDATCSTLLSSGLYQ